jgi:SAM-dependent methyltransferase
MIELARAEALPDIDYRVMEAEKLGSAFASGAFDMVTSCVALCDMPAPATAIRAVQSVLRPHGRFVFSTTHPCTDTPYRRWELDDAGQKRWLCIDRYFDRGPYEYTWTGWEREFTTPGLHVPLEDWLTWTQRAGFELHRLHEPRPTEEALRLHPDLEDATRAPYFLIFDLIRKP